MAKSSRDLETKGPEHRAHTTGSAMHRRRSSSPNLKSERKITRRDGTGNVVSTRSSVVAITVLQSHNDSSDVFRISQISTTSAVAEEDASSSSQPAGDVTASPSTSLSVGKMNNLHPTLNRVNDAKTTSATVNGSRALIDPASNPAASGGGMICLVPSKTNAPQDSIGTQRVVGNTWPIPVSCDATTTMTPSSESNRMLKNGVAVLTSAPSTVSVAHTRSSASSDNESHHEPSVRHEETTAKDLEHEDIKTSVSSIRHGVLSLKTSPPERTRPRKVHRRQNSAGQSSRLPTTSSSTETHANRERTSRRRSSAGSQYSTSGSPVTSIDPDTSEAKSRSPMRRSKDPDASTAFLSRHSFSQANIPETFLREPEATSAFLERSNDDGTLVRTVSVPATPIAAWEDVGNANDASEFGSSWHALQPGSSRPANRAKFFMIIIRRFCLCSM